MHKKLMVGLLSVLLIGLVIYGCGRVVEEKVTPTGTGSLIGLVKDTNGNPLGGVTVSVTGVTTTTASNANGYFSILSVPTTDRAIVSFSKSGYVSTYDIIPIKSGIVSYVSAYMGQASATQALSADNGGTVTDPDNTNASVTIAGGTLRDASGNVVTGNVDVGLTAFDPTDSNQRAAFPGNYAGVVNGQEQPFKSYGFMDVSVTQNGQSLTLGSTAEIEIPISASQVSTAPDTIDAWYFDTERGQWIKDGIFTKVDKGGGVYVYRKNISHFSTWNADYLYEQSYKRGRVVDGDGNPVPYAFVIAEANGWYNDTFTDENGYYTLPVEPNTVVQQRAWKATLTSDTRSETTGAAGETIDVPDLVLANPLATITLVWGENPRDLDSHLTGPPTSEGQTARFHCYFGRPDPPNAYASLDIDYTQGYGPEHVVITKFITTTEGTTTYRYAVHHYAGTGTISTSEAQVRLDIPSQGIIGQIFTPPLDQLPTLEVWRVFDLNVDSAGNVTVQTLGDYADEGDPDAYLITPGAFGLGLPKEKK